MMAPFSTEEMKECLLGKFIDGPVVLASLDHHNLCVVRFHGSRFAGCQFEQRDRKGVAAVFHLLTMADFVRAGGPNGWLKEGLDKVGRAVMLDGITKQKYSSFSILHLPGVEKVIGCGQGRNVVPIRFNGRSFGLRPGRGACTRADPKKERYASAE